MNKKLLFFTSDYKIGLSALMVDELIAFYKSGINLIGIGGNKEQEPGLIKKINNVNAPLILINDFDEHHNFYKKVKEIYKIICANNIDTVHVQNNWQLSIIAFIKYFYRTNIKIIYTIHAYRHNSKLKSIIARLVIGSALLLFADRIICMCNSLKKAFNLLSYKITLLPLGISDEFFTEEYIEPSHKGLQMIFPAQFRHGKNQDMIIRAFASHISKNNDTTSHLILPGEGALLNKMKLLSSKLNISDRITFPGQCTKNEIFQLYLKSNIGIVSSNSETFGQSIVEPFVLGRCIISTPVGIATDIIIDDKTGYIINSEKELVNILNKLYCHQNIIQDIGQNNFNRRNLFKWDKISIKYIELLNTL